MATNARADENSDEIDLVRIILVLWESRKWMLACMSFVILAGGAYALFAPAVYSANAAISLKEKDDGDGASRVLAQLGSVGGAVASQLGVGQTNLDQVALILKGHELAKSVIVEHGLLPVLYPDKWDAKAGRWKTKNPKHVPTLALGVKFLQDEVLNVSTDAKKGVIIIKADIYDSTLSKSIVDYYLAGLNERMRSDITRDAEANRRYLEQQLNGLMDPILREKVQSMIAYEIEKAMLASSNAFNVVEGPVVPLKRTSPRRLLILSLSVVAGAVASVVSVFARNGYVFLKTEIASRSSRGVRPFPDKVA